MIEKYCINYLRITITDFNTSYHGILSRSALAKFMAVPCYVYMIMKMLSPNGVIMVLGNVRIVYDCKRENLQIAATLELSVRIEEVLAAFKKVASEELEISTKKRTMEVIKAKPLAMKKVSLSLEDPSKMGTIGTNMDPK